MSCERNNRCGCGGNQTGGARDFPCREQLRALERCLRNLAAEEEEEASRPRPWPCRCCCCCCRCHHHGNNGMGNQTTWGR
ncbi:MAG TPA: hypothetical protein GX707_03325 [Epulopiscium sp.]|nr:hypothetical protein [Candidatus Epulonipiscium sp.]